MPLNSEITGLTTLVTYRVDLPSPGPDVESTIVTVERESPPDGDSDREIMVLNPSISSINVEVIQGSAARVRARLVDDSDNLSDVSAVNLGMPLDLNGHAARAVDYRIAPAFAAKSIFTTQNHSTGTYVRNPNCWCGDIDLTCMSPWNSRGGSRRAGTLVSPIHLVMAAHYALLAGDKVRFVDRSGNVSERTIVGSMAHVDYSPYYPDIRMAVLDREVPKNISFARFLPDDYATYLTDGIRYLPCLVLDQEEKALVQDGWSLTSTYTSFRYPTDRRADFSESIIGGDSGNPSFLIVDDQLVILTVWTYGGAGSGTSFTYRKDDINGMMQQLSVRHSRPIYQITEQDLSDFGAVR